MSGCFFNKSHCKDLSLINMVCLICVGRMQRKVLHRFVMMAKRTMPSQIGDQADSAEDKAAQEGDCIF